MMVPTTESSSYEAIVFLNNTAVSLLQRNRCKESIATFQEATELMKIYAIEDDETSHQIFRSRCESYLHKASKRIACPMKNQYDLSDDTVVVLDINSPDRLVEMTNRKEIVDYVFRLEHDEEHIVSKQHKQLHCDRSMYQMNSSVILYNTAIACKTLASSLTKVNSLKNHKDMAVYKRLMDRYTRFIQLACKSIQIELEDRLEMIRTALNLDDHHEYYNSLFDTDYKRTLQAVWISKTLSKHISPDFIHDDGNERMDNYDDLDIYYDCIHYGSLFSLLQNKYSRTKFEFHSEQMPACAA